MHIDTSGETRLYGQPGACSIASQPFRPHVIPAIHYPYVVCDKGSCMQLQLIDQHPSSLRFAYALCPCLYRDHAFRRNLIGEWIFQLAYSGEAGSVWSGPCTRYQVLPGACKRVWGRPKLHNISQYLYECAVLLRERHNADLLSRSDYLHIAATPVNISLTGIGWSI